MARPERFELPTLCFEGRCSIQLSYGRVVFSLVNRYFLMMADRVEVIVCPFVCTFRRSVATGIFIAEILYTTTVISTRLANLIE